MWIRFDTFPDIFHIVYTIDIYINSHIVLNYFFYKSVPYCHPIALYARVHTLHERFDIIFQFNALILMQTEKNVLKALIKNVLHVESVTLKTPNECPLQIIERHT